MPDKDGNWTLQLPNPDPQVLITQQLAHIRELEFKVEALKDKITRLEHQLFGSSVAETTSRIEKLGKVRRGGEPELLGRSD